MRKFITLAACVALVSCSGQSNNNGDDSTVQTDAPEPTRQEMIPVEPDGGIGDMPGGTPPPGQDGPQAAAPKRPMLQNMTYGEYSNSIEPGLGCSFQSGPEDGILLVASAPDDRTANGEAVVKLNDALVMMQYTGKGFGSLEKGGTFKAKTLDINIKRGAGEGKKVGIETMTWPATMTIAQDEGGTNSYKGTYACGA